jgi:predicted N-acyltransferase
LEREREREKERKRKRKKERERERERKKEREEVKEDKNLIEIINSDDFESTSFHQFFCFLYVCSYEFKVFVILLRNFTLESERKTLKFVLFFCGKYLEDEQ